MTLHSHQWAMVPMTGYSTEFPGTENPLSEGGVWTTGIFSGRTAAQSASGHAYGTMVGFDGVNYLDSAACLSGFPANHSVEATLYNNSAPSGLETELLLRVNLTVSSITAYEIDLYLGGTAVHVVRWNGSGNSFTDSSLGAVTNNVSFANGAVWSASISGNLINVHCNGAAVVTDLDITTAFGGGLVINSGNPGIGFWNETADAGNCPLFAWDNFTAAGL